MIYQNDRQCLAQAIPVKSRQAWGRILSWEAKNTGVPCYCGEIPFRNPCISAEMLLGPSNQANFEVVTRGETSIESYLWIVTCNRLQAKSETLWGILSGCNLCMCDLLKCLLHTWLLWFTGAFFLAIWCSHCLGSGLSSVEDSERRGHDLRLICSHILELCKYSPFCGSLAWLL